MVYIDAESLRRAGWPAGKDAPLPFYRVLGYQRSRNGHTVIVTLYGER